MGEIRKQTVYGSLIIYFGFLLGAFNLLFLYPRILPIEYIGLSRLIQDFSIIMSGLAGLGFSAVYVRFNPYYKKYTKTDRNDFFQLYLIINHIGLLLIFILIWFFKDVILSYFQVRSALFNDYYFLTYVFIYLFSLNTLFEAYIYIQGKAIEASFSRELLLRFIITIMLGITSYFRNSEYFIYLFSVQFIVPIIYLGIIIYRKFPFVLGIGVSNTSKRLYPFIFNMLKYNVFQSVIVTTIPLLDTIIIGSNLGLSGIANYQVMTYISILMFVPVRATSGIIAAKISTYWLENNTKAINKLFSRSSINYFIIGLLIAGLVLLNLEMLNRITAKTFQINIFIVLILMSAKLVELLTGVANVVLVTSKKWNIENLISIGTIILAVPLNVVLIKKYGLWGAACTTLMLAILSCTVRIFVINYFFKISPFSKNLIRVSLTFIILYLLIFLLHIYFNSIIFDLLISCLFVVLFLFAILKFKLSEDLSLIFSKAILLLRSKFTK